MLQGGDFTRHVSELATFAFGSLGSYSVLADQFALGRKRRQVHLRPPIRRRELCHQAYTPRSAVIC
jgi:hypothetical protein